MSNLIKKLAFFSILIICFGCLSIYQIAFAQSDYAEIQVVDGGTVIGNVRYLGDQASLSLDLAGGWDLTDTQKAGSEKLVVSKINNGLKNAVVSVTNIEKGKRKIISQINPIMDQQRNNFIPRVVPILTGTTVDILNGDDEMHNVHTKSVRNQPFNLGTTYKQRLSVKFDYPEIIKMTCDIHKKTYAWIVVLDNPYFDITDRNGYFEICDVPPGSYKFQVWHEELGKLEKEVTINPKEILNIEFVYSQN